MVIRSPYQSYLSGALGMDTYFLMRSDKTRPDDMNSSATIEIRPLPITALPKAMRKIGWKNSAKLMIPQNLWNVG